VVRELAKPGAELGAVPLSGAGAPTRGSGTERKQTRAQDGTSRAGTEDREETGFYHTRDV
jgi:hypothetical protein